MKCAVHKSVYKSIRRPILAWSSALLLFLLAACGGDAGPDYSNQEGVEVSIFASLGRTSTGEQASLSSQGVPVDPATGETGVDTAELEVYSGETRLFFRGGNVVDEAEGESVILTPDDSEVSLFLPEGNYRFALSALDEQNNVLARGQVEQQIGEESRVSIPLTSLLGSASFRVPESVTANAVFDAFLEVSPPNRNDLRVPLGDFTVSYEVKEPSVKLEGASNVGVRVAAACDVVEVTATVDNDLSEEVSASASIPVNDEACEEASETPVGTDLIPPFVSIKTPEANSTLNTSFTLQGDVNDQQSGVDKVEVYEGTVKLGEANIDSDSMMWSFDASLEEGSYTLIAIAFDKAGNTARAEVQVRVEEGAGGGDGGNGQTCTNPVNVPDEVLEQAIRDALGKQGGELTCEDLANLVEFNNDNNGISNLEGLQYALNLEVLDTRFGTFGDLSPLSGLTKLKSLILIENSISDISPLKNLTNLEILLLSNGADGSETNNNVTDLTPLSGLTKLDRLDIVDNGLSSLEGLQGLNLTDIDARDNSIEDLGPLSEVASLNRLVLSGNKVSDLGPLAGLSNLETLFLDDNQISDLSPLATLENLSSITLGQNELTDIQPLVENSGLGDDDQVVLTENPTLDTCPGSEARAGIDALIERGVDVSFNQPENCDGDGGDGSEGDDFIRVTSTSGAASLDGECTLRAAITAANTDTAVGGCPAGNGADTVVLSEGDPYTLTEVDNETSGSNGLPAITSEIELLGTTGVFITRAEDAPPFRLLYVAEGGNLSLLEVSVSGGVFGTTSDDAINQGGGIFNAGTLALENDSAIRGSSASDGGGLYNQGEATVRNSVISSNTTGSGRGGGIFNAGTVTLIGSSITENFESEGAGFYNTGTLSMQVSSIEGNTTPGTAGVFVNEASGVVELQGVEIIGNSDDGGGASNRGGEVTLTEVVYDGNSDSITNFEGGTLTLVDSTVSNTGPSYGPGISNEGTLNMQNSTVSGNELGGIGNSGTLNVAYSTVARNSGEFASENTVGISNDAAGTVALTGTIVAGNDTDCQGSITSDGYNLDSDGSCNLSAEGDLSSVDPLLAPLQENGVTLTHPLQEGSPAIDAIPTDVCSVDTDQRGVSRPQGGACDIGAFEVEQ